MTLHANSSNPFVGGKARPVTPEMLWRANGLGLDPERVKYLLKAGTDYEFNEDGTRIEPPLPVLDVNHFLKNDNHHMIKPDPRGVYYLKVTIGGKVIVKPLDKDEDKARTIRDKYLKELNFKPSRHSAR